MDSAEATAQLSSDEDVFEDQAPQQSKHLKLKNVTTCVRTIKTGKNKGQRCTAVSTLGDGLCNRHRPKPPGYKPKRRLQRPKTVRFRRLKKTKRYQLVRCLDKNEPVVILNDNGTLIRVRLPRNLKPIPRPKKFYLVYCTLLPERKVFAMWRQQGN